MTHAPGLRPQSVMFRTAAQMACKSRSIPHTNTQQHPDGPAPRFAQRRTPVTDRPPGTEEALSVTGQTTPTTKAYPGLEQRQHPCHARQGALTTHAHHNKGLLRSHFQMNSRLLLWSQLCWGT
jgi:hypothetical protein